MPKPAPPTTDAVAIRLRALGAQLRARRKHLRVSATSAAEAAGMSRVTLHRIETGEPSVTMGAYLNAIATLGMSVEITTPAGEADATEQLPERIRVADYPQLQQLAWQLQADAELTQQEALDIYERNQRHLDTPALAPRERALIQSLRRALRRGTPDV